MKRLLLVTTTLILLFKTSNLLAQAEAPGLFFPISKSSIQVLPQSFEYELIDKDRFRIGNNLFDARLFEFKVAKGQSSDKFRLKMRWPSGLLRNGEISIRDNIGKAIWIYPINKSDIRLSSKIIDKRRLETASLEADVLPTDIFQNLQYVPYFQVCIQKNELPTRIALCSKDFFVTNNKGRVEIRSRDSLRRESFVNINARNVDPQGVIYLQGTVNVISMRVLLLSGATLDVDTRKKDVEFRDIATNPKTGRLQVNGIGAEPTGVRGIKKMEDGSWTMELNAERPLLYLRGEGDIPMKQEFIVNGPLRDMKSKIHVNGPLPVDTYSSQVQIELQRDSAVHLEAGDEDSSLALNETGDAYIWTLDNLVTGGKNRRLLKVTEKSNSYPAGWDVKRLPRFDATIQVGFPVTAGAEVRGWLEDQHLGFGFRARYDSEWKKDLGALTEIGLPIYYSIPAHRNFVTPAWGAIVTPKIHQLNAGSSPGISLGGFWQYPLGESYRFLGDWANGEIGVFNMSMGNDIKAESEMYLKNEFMHSAGESSYWSWGLGFTTLKFTNKNGSDSLSRPALFLGYKFQF